MSSWATRQAERFGTMPHGEHLDQQARCWRQATRFVLVRLHDARSVAKLNPEAAVWLPAHPRRRGPLVRARAEPLEKSVTAGLVSVLSGPTSAGARTHSIQLTPTAPAQKPFLSALRVRVGRGGGVSTWRARSPGTAGRGYRNRPPSRLKGSQKMFRLLRTI